MPSFWMQTFMYDNDKASQTATAKHVFKLAVKHVEAARGMLRTALCQAYGGIPPPLQYEWGVNVVHLLNAGVHAHIASEWQLALQKLNARSAVEPWQPFGAAGGPRVVHNESAVRSLFEDWLEPWVFEQVREHVGPLATRLLFQLDRFMDSLSTRFREPHQSWIVLEEAGVYSRLACWWPLVKRTSILYKLLHEGINRRMRLCLFHVRQAMVNRLSTKLRGVRQSTRARELCVHRLPERSCFTAHPFVRRAPLCPLHALPTACNARLYQDNLRHCLPSWWQQCRTPGC